MNFPSSRVTVGLVATTIAVVALTGCTAPTTAQNDSGDVLRVVATTTQLTDFAGIVGGADIELTGLLPSGGSAHHFDPSPADLLALGQADVLVVNGAGLETFIDSAVDASGFTGTVITAADGIDIDEARTITAEASADAEHDHADHDHDHAEHDHAEHEHEHEHDHEHDHGDVNPHIWTSPHFASDMVREIAAGFSAADSEHAAEYTARADAYVAQLDVLDTWIHTQFERIPAAERVLVSGHDSLRYYLHDYNIAFAGAILPSFEDNAEPSAAQIDALVQEIRASGVKAIFVESSMSPKLAQTVAKEAGITVVDANALYADSLGTADSGADTYLGATIVNTNTILTAWGATPDALPTELQE